MDTQNKGEGGVRGGQGRNEREDWGVGAGDRREKAQEDNRESKGLTGFSGWPETLLRWDPESGTICFSHKGVKAVWAWVPDFLSQEHSAY